nr:uncharacterized protein LOC133612099 [Nerophis lumbriciformis]
MEKVQPLRDELSAALWQLEEELLVDVCGRLKFSGLDSRESRSKSRRALIQMAEGAFDEIEESEQEEQVEECYKELSKYLNKLNVEPLSKKGSEKLFDTDTSPKNTPSPLRVRPEQTHFLKEVTLRREFKICGQIGEPGQREKLSYLSLVRQIGVVTEKGHSETEIIEAVIRAISPGLPLRDMLEIKRELTLNKLFTILMEHYKVVM